jgi:DUF1365 family protein
MAYRFVLTPPGARLTVHISAAPHDAVAPPLSGQATGDRTFDATLTLQRRPWSAGEIRRALIRHPVMTAQVTAGIHWEAFRLWRKGVPVTPVSTS